MAYRKKEYNYNNKLSTEQNVLMDRLYKIKTSGMFIYFRIHILGKLLHIGTGYVVPYLLNSKWVQNKENGELYNTAITATAGTATIAVIFAVPLTVSFATVFAVSLAIFFTAFLKSFLPAPPSNALPGVYSSLVFFIFNVLTFFPDPSPKNG